jgi:hypothetical protein
MDTPDALSHIEMAMRTLEVVAENFTTPSVGEALKTAKLLVRLSQKRQQEDILVLNRRICTHGDADTAATPMEAQCSQQDIQSAALGNLDFDLNMTNFLNFD